MDIKEIMQRATAIKDATLAARARSGRSDIGVAVTRGRYQVQSVVFASSGVSAVEPITEYLSADDVIKYLNSI
jgi:hypothetical protein